MKKLIKTVLILGGIGILIALAYKNSKALASLFGSTKPAQATVPSVPEPEASTELPEGEPLTEPVEIPATPTGLNVSNDVPRQLILNWQPVAVATGYKVYAASTEGGVYNEIAAPTGTAYTQTGLKPGFTYFYKVVATNSAGNSAASNAVSGTVSGTQPVTLPAAPTGLRAFCPNTGQAATRAELSWVDNANNEVSYTIERDSTNSAMPNAVIIAQNLPANTVSYNDPIFTGTNYWYRVVAVNLAGRSVSAIVHAVGNSGTGSYS